MDNGVGMFVGIGVGMGWMEEGQGVKLRTTVIE